MPVSITCSSCQARLSLPDRAAGRKVRCPKCQAILDLTESSGDGFSLTPPAKSKATGSNDFDLPEASSRSHTRSRGRDREEDSDDDLDLPDPHASKRASRRRARARDEDLEDDLPDPPASRQRRRRRRRGGSEDLGEGSEDIESRPYVHSGCGAVTVISGPKYRDSLANPLSNAGVTICSGCKGYFPLEEFYWKDTKENIQDYRERLHSKLSGIECWLCGIPGFFANMLLGFLLGIVLAMVLGLVIPTWLAWVLGVVLALAGLVGAIHLAGAMGQYAENKMHAEEKGNQPPTAGIFVMGVILDSVALLFIVGGIVLFFKTDSKPNGSSGPRFGNRGGGGNGGRDGGPAGSTERGLRAYWAFDERQGTVTTDRSPKQLKATLSNCEWIQGIKGKAIELNGRSSTVQIATDPILTFAEKAPFTLAGWIKTTQTSKGIILSFRNSQDARTNDMIQVFVERGYLVAWVRHRNFLFAPDAARSPMKVNDGQWHHFAITRDETGEVHLIMDGAQKTKRVEGRMGRPFRRIVTDRHSLGTDANKLAAGWAGEFYEGAIDELGIYGSVLDDRTIRTMAQK